MLANGWNPQQTRYLGLTAPEWFAYGLALFLVLFPKGGFKAGSIPLTWGYAIIGVALVVGTPVLVLQGASSKKMARGTLGAFICLLPLQLLFVYSFLVNGVGDLGFAISDVVNFFVLPFAFLAVFPLFLGRIRMERFLTLVRWMVFLAAAYGIFLFAWRLATGKYIEIPFLTVNIADLGTLGEKFNSRPDGLFKLISTYNNGNQYGVATLLMLPLFDMAERGRFQKLIVRVALALTLSRTVWVGLVLNEALVSARSLSQDLFTRPYLRVRYTSAKRIAGLVILAIAVLGLTLLFSGISFLFDPNLGGRAEYLQNMGPITLLPDQPVAQFLEIIYYSALSMLGLSGLIAILLLFFSPLLLAICFKELRSSPVQIAALSGLLLYIPLAAMDGALNYIPTMAFYWFLWMLLIHARHVNRMGDETLRLGSVLDLEQPPT